MEFAYSSTPATPPLLRVRDVARRLEVSRATAYRLIGAGQIPAVRVGGSIRVDPAELDAYVYGEPTLSHHGGG